MEVHVLDNEHVIVQVSGDVELPHVDELRAAIEDASGRAPEGFIIDMMGVQYIDSAGISALVLAYRRVCSSGGRLAVVISNKNVKRIILLTRLDTLPGLSVCDDMASAEQAIAEDVGRSV
ncbi:MAG: STAS domain-containing protein [Armatimonadota bacterium]|nr:STAS domain-containing protein [bacterium]